jgi:hypothetical protein
MLVHDCSWRYAVVGGEAGQFAKPAIGRPLELAVCSRATGTGRTVFCDAAIAASKNWRRLKGTNHFPKIVVGVRFKDGIEVLEAPANHVA